MDGIANVIDEKLRDASYFSYVFRDLRRIVSTLGVNLFPSEYQQQMRQKLFKTLESVMYGTSRG